MDARDIGPIQRELENLKMVKADMEKRISFLEAQLNDSSINGMNSLSSFRAPSYSGGFAHGLSPQMIHRYSRHLLLPEFGVEGQSNLLKSSVLVVGAGGLGSSAALYLAACGVGCLGIIDHDVVELNNLHRQIIHTEAYIGWPKVKSAAASCRAINSAIHVVEHQEGLQTSNALDIISKYDVVIDATDNVPSRYLISDSCVLLGKPHVFGAALGFEGQLTVYHHNGGPCYRCLFPVPPPTAACQSCSNNGVLGVVPGVIGCFQALEAIKVACGIGESLVERMLIFDALSARIRIVKIRGRSLKCDVCGENSGFTGEVFQDFNYEKFAESSGSKMVQVGSDLDLLPLSARISCKDFSARITSGKPHVLVDVRPAHQFKIAALPKAINVPFSGLACKVPEIHSALEEEDNKCIESSASLFVVCRRGVDSQKAVQYLHSVGLTIARDITGGLEAWAREVDPMFPTY